MGAAGEGAWSARVLLVALLVGGAPLAGATEGAEAGPDAPVVGEIPGAEPPALPCPAGGACTEEEEAPAGAAAEAPAEAAPEELPLKLRLGGRVFARASADEREDYARNVTIPSARVGLEAEWGLVSAELSAELSSSRVLRDAYVRLEDGSGALRLTAGQFKSPFMARSLASSWALPLQSRGLVEDYLLDTHDLGGRRPGLMLEARHNGWARLRTSFGVFRGARDALGQVQGEDLAARITVRPLKGVDVGASGYAAGVGRSLGAERRWAGGGDLSVRVQRLHLTAEVLTGHLAVGDFRSQTALAWLDVPLPRAPLWMVQPVLGAEGLQLQGTDGAPGGHGWALVGGVNLLYGESFKVLLHGERAFRPGDERPGTAVGLQLAARFK